MGNKKDEEDVCCSNNLDSACCQEHPQHPRVFSAQNAPLGKYTLLWGKPGQQFPRMCLLGPHWPCLILSFALLWGISVAVLAGTFGTISPWFSLLGSASLALTTLTLCGAAFTDPGIIPRDRPQNTNGEQPHEHYTICPKCSVSRPQGAFHCRDCDVCIENVDHHCPWTGHCIGGNNLMYFKIYLRVLSAHAVIVVALALVLIYTVKNSTIAVAILDEVVPTDAISTG